MILGHGQAYPSSDRILDNSPMHVDYIKIYVDGVVEKYNGYPILSHTMKPEEVTDMGSTQGNFIQWPRKAIKPDEGHMTFQGHMEFEEEVNTGVSFMDLLNIEIPIQPSHTKDVADPKVIETAPLCLFVVKKRRPENIYRSVEELELKANESATVAVTSPNGMYKEPEVEHVEIKELINLSLDKWAELGTLNWYNMYLYALVEINSLNKTAYFNPHYIALNTIEANENLAINHIKFVMKYHKKRKYFMAPYLAGH
ncbi:hypothetical protein Hanom_Chr16g01463331 [Helianthus anomalus]